MVRPLQYSFMLCRKVLQKKGDRSYADMVKQATSGENKKGLSHVPGMGDGSENQHVVQKI